MGESPPPPTDGPARRRRKWRPWLRRLSVLGLLAIIAIGVALTWLWHRRTRLVNDLFNRALDPWSATVAHVDVDFWDGAVELRDLRIRAAPDAPDWLRAGRIRLSGTIGGLRRGRVDRVDMDSVVIEITDEWFDRFAAAGAGRSPSGGVPAITLGGVHARDVHVSVRVPGWPEFNGSFDYDGAEISSADGAWNLSRQVARIHEANVHSNGSAAVAASELEVEYSFDGTHRDLIVHRLAAPTLKLDLTPQTFAKWTEKPALSTDPPSSRDAAATSRSIPLASVVLGEIRFEFIDFRLAGFAGVPDMSFRARWHGGGARWDGAWSAQPQSVNLADARVTWAEEGAAPFFTAPAIGVHFSLDEQSGARINRLSLDGPSISLRPEDVDKFQPDGKPAQGREAEPAQTGPLVVFDSVAVTGARLAMSGFGDGAHRSVPNVRAAFDAGVEALAIRRDGSVSSTALQWIKLREAEAGFPDQLSFARLVSAEIELIPDDLIARRIIRNLRLGGPEVEISPEVLAHFASSPVSIGPAVPPGNQSAPKRTDALPQAFSWTGLHAQQLTIDDGQFTLRQLDPSIPEFSARVGVTTLTDDPTYEVKLTDVTVRAPAADPELATFGHAPAVVAIVHPVRLWQSAIDSVTIENAEIEVGKAVRTLTTTGPSRESPASAEERPGGGISPSGPGWRIGKLAVDRSRVTVADVVPLLDPAAFEVTWSATDIPLTSAGLAAQAIPQRVELSDIQLHAAQNTGPVPVAKFPTVFVEFTLAGLIDQRIDRIELISPVIYVGEQLFWYVEHFRKQSASLDESQAPNVTPPGPNPSASPGWSVGRIDAHLGKMLLALKGSVIDSLPPLPFSCSTQIDEGRLDLVLEFPRGTYRPSSRVALEVDIEEGSATFNLPLKQRSNNLVQVFRVSELRYGRGQPFRVRNAFMTVTFDKDGVYGKLGGELYGGYASGGFDVYLDDNTSWDCWVAGDNINMKPVTDILTPEYLRVEGPLEFKLIAFGDLESLYTANGDLRIRRPGHLTLACLDGLRDTLPGDWAPLETSLATTGIDTLRDFPFDHCRGNFEIYGWEGKLAVDLSGRHGTRAVKVEVHNHTAGAPGSIADDQP